MSSTGQAVGMVVGGVIGFFAGGNVMLGASIGGAIGSAIDPPKGPDIIGPRLDDLSIQTSTYGAPIARAYGTVSVVGNLFWLEGDKLRETTVEEEQGGKGGGGQSTTTYKYSATFAVGLLHVPDGATVALRRLWIETDLIYESGSDNTESTLASMEQVIGMMMDSALSKGDSGITGSGGAGFSFYPGSDDQLPNARMQADKGIANVSAYPGLCYIVMNDLDLEKYSNTLLRAQVKCELVISGDITPQYDLIGSTSNTALNRIATAVVGPSATKYFIVRHDDLDNITSAAIYEYRYGESDKVLTEIAIALPSGYGHTAPQIQTCHQCAPGEIVAFAIENAYIPAPDRMSLVRIMASEYVYGTQENDGIWVYGSHYIFASNGTTSFAASSDYAVEVLKFSVADHIKSSSVTVKASSVGYSENFVYVANATSSSSVSCVIEKFTHDLDFVETLTLAVNGLGAVLQVIGDDVFYIKSGAYISMYDGVAAYEIETTAPISSYPDYSWFAWGGVSPSSGITMTRIGPTPYDLNLFHSVVEATPAKLRDIVTAECALAGVASGDLDLDELTNSDVRGYKIAARSSVRAALEPLQAAFPFDVAASGYKVRFVSRGGASVATIPSDDLGATDGDEFPVLLPVSREMESQLPYRVNVRYADAGRDYDIGEQYAERPAESISERTIELAIVMTADEAAQTADVLLEKEWVERIDLGPFVLPPTWIELEAADVVTIEHRGQQHEARLTRVEYLPDGRLQCSAKKTQAASYVSTAQGSDPLSIGQSLVPLRGSTTGHLLDIPRIRSEQDVFGMSYGLLGIASGWPGGVLLRSDDSGNTYQSIGAMNSRARVFDTSDSLSAHHGYSTDWSDVLTVTPRYSSATLSSVSEELFYSQSNLAAYGADGRWEIVSFRTVTDNTGSYTLSDFLRGLYGSEWASGLHVAGDLLIMLDTSTISFFGLPTSALGSPRLYRAVTQGASIDSATDEADTYDAVNLMPLSPVDISGAIDAITNDWTVSVISRSRWPVEVFSGYTVPASESPESYVFEIYTSGTYATLARTITSATPGFAYTSAQQITDLGAVATTLYIKAYQVSATVGRGFALATSVTAPVLPDPYINLVTSLLHFEGPNASTTITDQIAGNTWTASGNAQLTTTAPLYGTSSLTCDGTTDYVYANAGTNFTAGLGDFTFEFSYTPTSLAAIAVLVDFRPGSTNGAYHYVDLSTGGILGYYVNSAYRITGTAVLVVGTRYRIAVSRVSGITRLFVEGVQDGSSYTDGFNYTVGANRPMIGANGSGGGTNGANGKFDEWRYTKAGRYAAGYTPSATPFPNP